MASAAAVPVVPGDQALKGAAGRRELLLALLVLAPLYTFRLYTARLDSGDEAWFLQVLSRCVRGEALYSDVYLGTTPLSLYLALPLQHLAGVELWAQRLIALLAALGTALACLLLAAPHTDRLGRLLLLAALAACGVPLATALYSGVGTLFLVLAALAAVSYTRTGRAGLPLWAGAAAGLAFGAKQNYGALAFLAVLAALALRREPAAPLARRLGAAGLGFAGAVALVLAPSVLTGSGGAFVDCTLGGKGHYLAAGGRSYLTTLGLLLDYPGLIGESVSARLWFARVLLPVPAVAAFAVGFRRAQPADRPALAALGVFLAAALAGVFPRADEGHVHFALPLAAVALAVGLRPPGRHDSARRRGAAWAGVALFAGAAFVPAAAAAREVALGEAAPSSLPHMRGVFLSERRGDAFRKSVADLRAAGATDRTFLLSWEAGFHYLAAGIRNPTPYDYPLVTAFGRAGQARLEAEIAAGGGPIVALHAGRVPLWPYRLENAVRTHMRLRGSQGPWSVYEPRR